MNPSLKISHPKVPLPALDLGIYPAVPGKKSHQKMIFDQYGLDPVELLKPADCKIIATAKKILEQMEFCYYEYVPQSLQSKISWIGSLIESAIDLIGIIVKFVKALLDGIRQTSSAINDSSAFAKAMGKAKILGALGIIGVISDIVENVGKLKKAIEKKQNDIMIDRGLMLVENASSLAVVGETVAVALKEFGNIGATSALGLASNICAGIGAVLSFATIALNSKHWYETAQFRERMNEKFGNVEGKDGNFTELVAFINEHSLEDLKNRFGVKDSKELKLRLQAILEKAKNSDPENSKEIAEKTFNAMKKRLITKEIFHGLKIAVAVISIIAAAILIFTPAAPAGYALLAAGSVVTISILVAEFFMDSQTQNILKEIVPDSKPGSLSKPPVLPLPLTQNSTFEEREEHKRAKKKYQGDLDQYNEDLEQHWLEKQASAPLVQHLWKTSGKKRWLNKTAKIRGWKPKVWKPQGISEARAPVPPSGI